METGLRNTPMHSSIHTQSLLPLRFDSSTMAIADLRTYAPKFIFSKYLFLLFFDPGIFFMCNAKRNLGMNLGHCCRDPQSTLLACVNAGVSGLTEQTQRCRRMIEPSKLKISRCYVKRSHDSFTRRYGA